MILIADSGSTKTDWRLIDDKYNMVITENKQAPQIPLGGDMQALS